MKRFKKRLALVLSLAALLSFTSCQMDISSLFENRDPVQVEKPDYETQTVSYKDFTLDLPASWGQIDATDGSDILVYTPSESNSGGSTFNLSIEPTDLGKYTLVKFSDAMRKSLPQQVAEIFPEAALSEFEYSDFRAPCGDVFVAEYTVTQPDGAATTYTQFYPLVDHYLVSITAENKGDGATPAVADVARYAASTLQVPQS